MKKLKLFSIRGEFGVWQIRAINREKAVAKLAKFFEEQDRKNRMEEHLSDLVEIPRSWRF